MVAATGLIVYDGDKTGSASAEGVLGCGIGDPPSGKWLDVSGGAVGAAFDLVERAGISRVERACSSMCGDTGSSTAGILARESVFAFWMKVS